MKRGFVTTRRIPVEDFLSGFRPTAALVSPEEESTRLDQTNDHGEEKERGSAEGWATH